MIETYSSKLATRRWPVALFCNLLDIAALNAYVLFEKLKMDGAGKENRRLFTKRLGKGLCQELQEYRRIAIRCNSSQSGHSTDTEGPPKKLGRCHVCPQQTDKKATAVCKACQKNVCPVHCEIFCQSPN